MALPISIQLYTVRDLMKEDHVATLKGVKEIGYEAVEWAGFAADPAELKKICDDLGLVSTSAHVGLQQIEKEVNAVADAAKTLGYVDIVVPYAQTDTVEATETLIAGMNSAAATLKEAGLRLGYHNHGHELQMLENGKRPIEMLAEQCPELLFEFDMGWVWVGLDGANPAAYVAPFAGRVPLLHIKDFKAPAGEKKMCEIGAGEIDYQAVVDAAEGWGTKYLIAEQDHSWVDDDPMKSAKMSFDGLMALVK